MTHSLMAKGTGAAGVMEARNRVPLSSCLPMMASRSSMHCLLAKSAERGLLGNQPASLAAGHAPRAAGLAPQSSTGTVVGDQHDSPSISKDADHAVLPDDAAQECDHLAILADLDSFINQVVPSDIHELLTVVIHAQCADHERPAIALADALKSLAGDEQRRLLTALEGTRSFEGRVLYNLLVQFTGDAELHRNPAPAGKGRGDSCKGKKGGKGISPVPIRTRCRQWQQGWCNYGGTCRFAHD